MSSDVTRRSRDQVVLVGEKIIVAIFVATVTVVVDVVGRVVVVTVIIVAVDFVFLVGDDGVDVDVVVEVVDDVLREGGHGGERQLRESVPHLRKTTVVAYRQRFCHPSALLL